MQVLQGAPTGRHAVPGRPSLPGPLQKLPQLGRPHKTRASTSNGASSHASNGAGAGLMAPPDNGASNGVTSFLDPEPLSETVSQRMQEAGFDLGTSGLRYLSDEARTRYFEQKVNKVEKMKAEKCGSSAWQDVSELGELIRAGKTNWDELKLDDIDMRMKWSGLFHRRKRAPGTFMMRLKVPNGDLTVKQLNYLGDCIAPFGENGCGDITTRANAQLRGITLAEADHICKGLVEHGLSSVMSGLDNVRNITGSPISGIDPLELLDVRPLVHAINAMHTNQGHGNPELANLPRKLNIGLSNSRDDFPHTHINDVGLKAVKHPQTGEVGFNVELGGYFSVKRNTVSIDGNTFVAQDQVVAYCKALLEVFRDHGPRLDRQKTRLMWLVEEWGADKFREAIGERMGGVKLQEGAHEEFPEQFKRRDLVGIHPQKQEGLSWACACVPTGRIFAQDFYDFARVAEEYGDGTVRLTVEQNVLFPNIPNDRLEALRADPLFERYKLDPPPLTRGLVSCTGSQFCGVALIETKNRAMDVVAKLEEQLDFPDGQTPRMHWTGCPNSCGQVQVADIGLMGGPARHNGKAVEGVRIFKGGSVGEGAELGAEFEKGVACADDVLLPKLRELLISDFGAKPKAGVLQPA